MPSISGEFIFGRLSDILFGESLKNNDNEKHFSPPVDLIPWLLTFYGFHYSSPGYALQACALATLAFVCCLKHTKGYANPV